MFVYLCSFCSPLAWVYCSFYHKHLPIWRLSIFILCVRCVQYCPLGKGADCLRINPFLRNVSMHNNHNNDDFISSMLGSTSSAVSCYSLVQQNIVVVFWGFRSKELHLFLSLPKQSRKTAHMMSDVPSCHRGRQMLNNRQLSVLVCTSWLRCPGADRLSFHTSTALRPHI